VTFEPELVNLNIGLPVLVSLASRSRNGVDQDYGSATPIDPVGCQRDELPAVAELDQMASRFVWVSCFLLGIAASSTTTTYSDVVLNPSLVMGMASWWSPKTTTCGQFQ
jgi:hypothetical protein